MVKSKYRILIIGNKERFIHLRQFSIELGKKGIEAKLIYDMDFLDKFFEVNILKKNRKKNDFKKIIKEFEPNLVLLDRVSKIAEQVIDENIPLWILLRGNYWDEAKWAKETIYKSKIKRLAIEKNEKLVDYCFKKSDLILPISKYLENEVKKRYPNKKIELFPADGRTPKEWHDDKKLEMNHPCVGLLQGLNIWGKTKELLTLKKVLNELPNVTFYLAGDGIYEKEIIPELIKFKNFVWLKNIEYPNDVKRFFSAIDIFMLLSGLEGLGQTIIEASLMKKPIIASNVGGIPDLIENEKTGILVENGDSKKIISAILSLINDPNYSEKIAQTGYDMVIEKFSWVNISKKFESIIEIHHNRRVSEK